MTNLVSLQWYRSVSGDRQNFPDQSLHIDYSLTKLTSLTNVQTGSGFTNLVCGTILNRYPSGSMSHLDLTILNAYFISGTVFNVSDTLTVGSKRGIVKYVKSLPTDSCYDQLIFVEHSVGTVVFSAGDSVTTGTHTGKIYYPIIQGTSTQINYNLANGFKIKFQGFYDVTIKNYDTNFVLTESNLITKSQDYKIYLNGVPNGIADSYQEILVPLGEPQQYDHWSYGLFGENTDGWWKRQSGQVRMYINQDVNEYLKHPNADTALGLDLPYGCVRFERFNGLGVRENLLTVHNVGEYPDQVMYGHGHEDDHRTITDMLRDYAGEIRYCIQRGDYGNLGSIRYALANAYQMRYFQIYGPSIENKFSGDLLYLKKSDLVSKLGVIRTDQLTVKVDGSYYISMPTEMYATDSRPSIERLRNVTRQGLNEQIGIVSRNRLFAVKYTTDTPDVDQRIGVTIDSLPLFVVDLGAVKSVKYMDITAGYTYKPTSYNDPKGYPMNFYLTIKYCPIDKPYQQLDESDFDDISDKTVDIDFNEAETKSLDSSALGDRFQTRYLKYYISSGKSMSADIKKTTVATSGDSTTTTTEDIGWYGAAIAGLAIYSDDVIVGEAYVASNIISMYKDTNVYDQLYTQAMVDRYAQTTLDEYQAGTNAAAITMPFAPHLEIGQTVYLADGESGTPGQNYFIEDISASNGFNIGVTHY